MYLPQSTAIKLTNYVLNGDMSRSDKARYEYYTRAYEGIISKSNSRHHAIATQVSAALEAGDRVRLVAALTVAAALPAIPAEAQVEELPA